jgi:diguanylate cyclase (GGDEF)-like protein
MKGPVSRLRHSTRAVLAALALAAAGAAAAHPGLLALESRLRGQPEALLAELQPLQQRLLGNDLALALWLQGTTHVNLSDPAGAEPVAQQLDALAAGGNASAAAAAAALVRARAAARNGPASRADRLLAEAQPRLPADAPVRLRLAFLEQRARTQQALGKLDLAMQLAREGVLLADRSGFAPMRVDLRGELAYALVLAQQPEAALPVNDEALQIARAAADLFAESRAMTIRGIVVSALGRQSEELEASIAAIDLARRAGSQREEVLATANLADFFLKRGDHTTALALSQLALPLARMVKDSAIESVSMSNAGLAMIALGRHAEGRALVQQALALEESAGSVTHALSVQAELGAALEQAGLLKEAWATLSEQRRGADEMFQRQHQQAVFELQESLEAERRGRELAALQTESELQQAQLTQRSLQQRLTAAATLAGALLLGVVVLLLRRMRQSNVALQDSNAQLRLASELDPLTGLANRRHLLQVMQQAAPEGAFEGSMLLIDIDHFKRINDEQGHTTGDQVLVEVARRLRAALRESDLTVRWGGEEFLVVVHALPAAEVEALAGRLLAAIGGTPVAAGAGQPPLRVTASIGFATFPLPPLREALGWERAIDLVDTAMYLAKAHGRNRAYGVRALHEGPGAGLENAWRSGRAELAQFDGPGALEAAP